MLQEIEGFSLQPVVVRMRRMTNFLATFGVEGEVSGGLVAS